MAVQLQLEISGSSGGFEAVQTWREAIGSWGADTELRHSMVPVVYVLSVHPSAEELPLLQNTRAIIGHLLAIPLKSKLENGG